MEKLRIQTRVLGKFIPLGGDGGGGLGLKISGMLCDWGEGMDLGEVLDRGGVLGRRSGFSSFKSQVFESLDTL